MSGRFRSCTGTLVKLLDEFRRSGNGEAASFSKDEQVDESKRRGRKRHPGARHPGHRIAKTNIDRELKHETF